MNMKANELMVGDFVMMGKKIYRCANICGHTNDVLLDNGVITNVGNLSPIPLTPEILEKNGFKIEIAEYTPNWKRCILNPNFFLEDRLKGCYHFNGNSLAKINYVQELQHALRLCGIEKNIII